MRSVRHLLLKARNDYHYHHYSPKSRCLISRVFLRARRTLSCSDEISSARFGIWRRSRKPVRSKSAFPQCERPRRSLTSGVVYWTRFVRRRWTLASASQELEERKILATAKVLSGFDESLASTHSRSAASKASERVLSKILHYHETARNSRLYTTLQARTYCANNTIELDTSTEIT